MGYVTWPRPFQGRSVICRLGRAMLNAHTKFEMSTIVCNKEMESNAKCKNSRFEPPFGGRLFFARGAFIVHATLSISRNTNLVLEHKVDF